MDFVRSGSEIIRVVKLDLRQERKKEQGWRRKHFIISFRELKRGLCRTVSIALTRKHMIL